MRALLLLSVCLPWGPLAASAPWAAWAARPAPQVLAAFAAQPAPQAPATFAVATIKPSASGEPTMTQIRGNRFVTQGTTFLDLFKYAYDVHPEQVVGGPDWLRSEKFDVNADPETEKRPNSPQMKALVQQLLVERFQLVMHPGQKVLSVYTLEKAGDVPKLKQNTTDPNGIPAVAYDPNGHLSVVNATMANLANFLQRFVLDRPAVDRTGVPGHFDLELHWTPDNFDSGSKADASAADTASDPGLFTAMREQLGLRLKAAKVATPVFIIDSAQQPSAN